MTIYVLHHADTDGRAAGYAAWRRFYFHAHYHEVQYGQPFPLDLTMLTKEDEIYILDFSYSRVILEQVNVLVGKLVVLDHHKTAEEELRGLPYAIFDMSKSGALLGWEYFLPNEEVPKAVILANDWDLWTFEYPETKAFQAGVIKTNVGNNWKKWYQLCTDDFALANVIKEGYHILEQQDNLIAKYIRGKNNILVTTFRGLRVALYNYREYISEMAEAIYLDKTLNVDFTWGYFFLADGKCIFNYRAPKSNSVDVSEIAKSFGGGGHEKSAGASLEFSKAAAILAELYK